MTDKSFYFRKSIERTSNDNLTLNLNIYENWRFLKVKHELLFIKSYKWFLCYNRRKSKKQMCDGHTDSNSVMDKSYYFRKSIKIPSNNLTLNVNICEHWKLHTHIRVL